MIEFDESVDRTNDSGRRVWQTRSVRGGYGVRKGMCGVDRTSKDR